MKINIKYLLLPILTLFITSIWFSCDWDPFATDPPAVPCPPPDDLGIVSFNLEGPIDTVEIGWTTVPEATMYHLVIQDNSGAVIVDTMLTSDVSSFVFTGFDLNATGPLMVILTNLCGTDKSEPTSITFAPDITICDIIISRVDDNPECDTSTCQFILMYQELHNKNVYKREEFCACLSNNGNNIFECLLSEIHYLDEDINDPICK